MDTSANLQNTVQPSSETLMLAYAAGDMNAFTQLYKIHKGPLFRFLLRQGMISSRAEEMFQEIWLKVIKASANYQTTARFQTWLYSIARNHLIDEYRRDGKADIIEFVDEQVENTHSSSAEDYIDYSRQHQKLLTSITELPFEQRQAFLLRFEAGMNSESIAKVTGTNLETAKSRVRYAINQLRIKLGGSQ